MVAKFREHNWYVKKYNIDNLLCSVEDIKQRFGKLQGASHVVDNIPEIIIHFTANNHFIVRQRYVHHEFELHENSLLELARNLDSLHGAGFIHGDINLTNVVLNNGKFYLIDIEPCFYQLYRGKKITKSSRFTRSKVDKVKGKLSFLTDKIGYYKLCYKYLNGVVPNITMDTEINLLSESSFQQLHSYIKGK